MWLFIVACNNSTTDTSPKESVSDSDTTTTPSEEVWPNCPDASAYVGDTAWTGTLSATAGALYCNASNEARTLPQELDAKAQLRVIEGDWKLPTEAGHYDLALPICTQRAIAGIQPDMAGAGSTDAAPKSFGGTTYTYLEGSQPFADAQGTPWILDHTLVMVGAEGSAPSPLSLDGHENDANAGSGASFTLYRAGASAYDLDAIPFSPCQDPTWLNNIHTVKFEGGDIKLELYLGDDPIITAPGNFRHASGSLDGTPFDISNFFQLIYRPGHHHMDRHFAVIFDAPIGDACALLIEDIDMQENTMTAKVSTASCELEAIAERTVSGEGFSVP